MAEIYESKQIAGVFLAKLVAYSDDRGRFLETFRKSWFPQRSWDIVQTNRSDSKAGVLRGLHYHRRQVDYWYVPQGKIQVGLYDLRQSSPTCGAHQMLEIGDDNQMGVFIPIGVAHGFVALTDATLTYLVDNYYDGDDEFGLAWNDPALNMAWAVENPILSGRDQGNPLLANIPPDQRPQ